MQELFLLHVASASILLANHTNVGLCVSKVCVYLTTNLFKIIVNRSVIFGSKFTKNRLTAQTCWGELTVLPLNPQLDLQGGSPGRRGKRGRGEKGKWRDGTPNFNNVVAPLDNADVCAMQGLCVFSCGWLCESTQSHRQHRSCWQHQSS